MKNLIMIFSLICLFNCSSKDSGSINLNNTSWGTIYDKDILGDYIELYFTEENVYYFEGALGLTKLEYKIENGVFSTRFSPDSSFTKRSEIRLKKDTLYLKEIGGIRKVENIIIKNNTIKDLIEGDIDESSFRRYFDERLLQAIKKK